MVQLLGRRRLIILIVAWKTSVLLAAWTGADTFLPGSLESVLSS